MVLFRRAVAILSAIALAFVALPTQAATPVDTKYVEGTDPAAAMYNPLVVNRINLSLPQATVNGLDGTTNYWGNEGPYLPAQLSAEINGISYGPMDVGVHLKGAWGSWRNIYGKAGFKVKIDFKNKTQNLLGVTKLTLNNMVQDQSSLHETMAYRLFRNIGVPTARTGYADVFVNGVNYGLHLNLETLDTTLLKRWGITPTHIYKGGVPLFPDFWPGQESNFAIDQGSTTDVSDLTAILAVVGRGNGANWFRDMSAIADLREMTLDWAAEKFTGHWDGYVNNHNNFYLVKRQDGKFIMLPWGMDQTWNGGLDYWNGSALFSQCLADSQCLALYKEALVKVVHTAKDLDLPQLSRDTAAVINPHLLADTKKEFGNWEIPGNQSPARSFINSQVAGGLGMIAGYDASLKSFTAEGFPTFQASETLTVPNETKTIQLVGTPYSNGANAALPPLKTLKVGLNSVSIRVTHLSSQIVQETTVKVYRMAALSTSANIVFTKKSSTLSAKAKSQLHAVSVAAAGSSKPVLTIKMQNPSGMSSAAAVNLLKARASKIQAQFTAGGIAPIRVSLIMTTVKGAETVSVTLGYQR
jgi:hypothetical protein